MTVYHYESDITVDLVSEQASDALVVAAARVSTLGANSHLPSEVDTHAGLINFLVKNRHGSPFEHNQFIFKVNTPIFVWREHMRHRIGFSYNEESGRYKVLESTFYVPDDNRNLVQEGKPGEYVFLPGDKYQKEIVFSSIRAANEAAYDAYLLMLSAGIAREVARMVLPVNIFSSAYVTMNARSLMNFLSLRTKDETSLFPSFPQREIEMVAEKYEEAFSRAMPLTHEAFCNNGRVAP
jgi:thymidylate synthase (FAD)